MSNSIKEFNVRIGEDSEIFGIGANATNIVFTDDAIDPYKNEELENSVPAGLSSKASNIIYGNAYLRNTRRTYVDGVPNVTIDEYNEAKGEAQATLAEPKPSDVTPAHDETNAGAFSISYGIGSIAKGHNASAIGFDCEALGWASHAEGWKTKTGAMSNYAHAEGANTNAMHNIAHAEGDATNAEGYGSHSEGRGTWAQGVASHSEGVGAKVIAEHIVRENTNIIYGQPGEINDVSAELTNEQYKQRINGQGSHAEGFQTEVRGAFCHGGGILNKIDKVYGATVFGEQNIISANNGLGLGTYNTISNGADNSLILGEHNDNTGYPNSIFLGKYCDIGENDNQKPALVIGSGIDKEHKSNLLTIRHPQTGMASQSNRGELWGEHVNAHFYNVTAQGDMLAHGKITGALDNEVHYISFPGDMIHPTYSNVYEYSGCLFGGYYMGAQGRSPRVWSKNLTLTLNWIKTAGVLQVVVQPCNVAGKSFVGDANPGGAKLYFLGYSSYAGQGGAIQTFADVIKQNCSDSLINWIKNDLYCGVDTTLMMHTGTPFDDEKPAISYCKFHIQNLVKGELNPDDFMIGCPNGIGADYHPLFQFTFYGKPKY